MNLLWKCIIKSISLAWILIWKRVTNWNWFNFGFNLFFFLLLNFIFFFFFLLNFNFFYLFFLLFLFSKSKEFSKETLFLLGFFFFNFFFISTFLCHLQILFTSKFYVFSLLFIWNCSCIWILYFCKVFYLYNLVLSAEPFIKIVYILYETHSLKTLLFTLNVYSHFSIPVFSVCLCISNISTSGDISTLLNRIFTQYFKVCIFF